MSEPVLLPFRRPEGEAPKLPPAVRLDGPAVVGAPHGPRAGAAPSSGTFSKRPRRVGRRSPRRPAHRGRCDVAPRQRQWPPPCKRASACSQAASR